MKRLLIAFICASTAVYGSTIYLVTNGTSGYSSIEAPAALSGSTNFVQWSQLGSSVSQSFSAWSSENAFVSGGLGSGTGKVVTACATCKFQSDNGIGSNDALVLTNSTSSQGAPVTLNVSPEYGVGAYIQAASINGDTGAQFTARIQAFAGVTSVLNTTVTSDLAGDAVFLGVSASVAEITRVIFTLTDANGNPTAGNYVLDSVYLQNAFVPVVVAIPAADGNVPEPNMMSLVGSGLLALVFGLRKRAARVLNVRFFRQAPLF